MLHQVKDTGVCRELCVSSSPRKYFKALKNPSCDFYEKKKKNCAPSLSHTSDKFKQTEITYF